MKHSILIPIDNFLQKKRSFKLRAVVDKSCAKFFLKSNFNGQKIWFLSLGVGYKINNDYLGGVHICTFTWINDNLVLIHEDQIILPLKLVTGNAASSIIRL